MIDRLFRKVSYVQIMVNTASSIAMIVDNMVIGKFLGVTAIGAYGLVSPLLFIIMAISQVLSTGGQVKCSEELGHGNKEKAAGAASLTILLGLMFSVLSIAVCFSFQDFIAQLLGAQSGTDLFTYTVQYMLGFIIGAPGFIGMLVLIPFIQLDGDKKCVLISTLAMTAADIAGDLIVVTVFKGGMFGIGVASSISYYIALIVLLSHYILKKSGLKLGFKHISFRPVGEILKSGSPAALQKVLRTFLSLTINYIIIAFCGSAVLGTFTVINSILNLFNSSGQGMGAGTLLLTRLFYASDDRNDLREVVRAFVRNGLIINAGLIILVIIFASPLITLFTRSGDINVAEAGMALRIASVDFIFLSLANCFNKYYQGTKRIGMAYIITIAEAFLFSAIAALPLTKLFGVYGICSTLAVGDFLSLVMIYIIVGIRRKSFVFSVDNFMMLDETFGAADDCCYRKTITTLDDVEKVSLEVRDFTRDHAADGDPDRLAQRLSLCVEEICKNIVTHGFSDKKKNHLEVSMMYKDGHFTLRIRDDCRKYDPVEFYRQYTEKNNGELGEKYGLKIVFGLMKDIDYFGTLGLNTLVIKS